MEVANACIVASNTTRYDSASLEAWCSEFLRRLWMTNREDDGGNYDGVVRPIHVQYWQRAHSSHPVATYECSTFRYSHLRLINPNRLELSAMDQLATSLKGESIQLNWNFYESLAKRLSTLGALYHRSHSRAGCQEIAAEMVNEGLTIHVRPVAEVRGQEAKLAKTRADAQVRQEFHNRLFGYRLNFRYATSRGLRRHAALLMRTHEQLLASGGQSDLTPLRTALEIAENEAAYLRSILEPMLEQEVK